MRNFFFFRKLKSILSGGNALIIGGMLFLIFAQMTWWIIFFEINYRSEEKRILDSQLRLETVLNHPQLQVENIPDLIREDGKWKIDPSVNKKAAANHKRKLIMLMSETLFALLVVSYGSFRVFRSVVRERRLNHERNLFINSVSHELKTPLASILLNLQTMEKRKLSEQDQKQLIEEGIESVRRLEDQLNNLLLGAEILRKRSDHSLKDFGGRAACNPSEVIKKYLNSNRSFFEKNSVTLHTNLIEDIEIQIPEDYFSKIAGNLISNAVQYSGNHPEITIELTKEKNYGLLKVEDKGQGIPKKEQFNIFQALYRLEKNTRPIRGSGMGLYISKEITEAYRGNILVHSSGENKGSKFEVRLPLARG